MIVAGHVSSDSSGNATGYEFNSSPNQTAVPRLVLASPQPYGKWFDVILEVKWATTGSGYVNGWIRADGAIWKECFRSQDVFGKLVPTQQYGSNVEGHTIDVNGIDAATGHPYVTCDKMGLYAGPSADAADLYHKRLVRGTSFDVVAAKLV
jgi:hypothetical protein